jgi:hypothetical protein
MTRLRARAILGTWMVGGVAAVVGMVATNCAEPTQITLEIRAEASICASLKTGIAVTSPGKINDEPFEKFTQGCVTTSDADGVGALVGTLTITPSGAKDDWIGIRVVGAVDGGSPEQCGMITPGTGQPDWSRCVLARRTLRFAPSKTTATTIYLSKACVGSYCGGSLECMVGQCVTPDKVDTTGNPPVSPVADGGPDIAADASSDAEADTDAGADAGADGGADAWCNQCKAAGGTCAITGQDCIFTCGAGQSCTGNKCPSGLNCTFTCSQNNSCSNLECKTTGNCTILCAGKDSCRTVSCEAASCSVDCSTEGACDRVSVQGASNQVDCAISGSKVTCDNVACDGGTCTRDCGQDARNCGRTDSCRGNCTGTWQRNND